VGVNVRSFKVVIGYVWPEFPCIVQLSVWEAGEAEETRGLGLGGGRYLDTGEHENCRTPDVRRLFETSRAYVRSANYYCEDGRAHSD
jgi:hypothetical protein